MNEMYDIKRAPRDGTPILIKLKDVLPPSFLSERERWQGKSFVAQRWDEGPGGWIFAAPVGCGGFADEHIEGWWYLPKRDVNRTAHLLTILSFMFWYQKDNPRVMWGGIGINKALSSLRELLGQDQGLFDKLKAAVLQEDGK